MIGGPVVTQQILHLLDRALLPVWAARLLRTDVGGVDHCHVEGGRLFERRDARGLGCPDEVGVFADVDIREAVLPPEGLRVTQRSSGQPRARTGRIYVA